MALAGLGDSQGTVPHVLLFPNSLASTAFLPEHHNFSGDVVVGDCPQDQAVETQRGDGQDTALTANVASLTAEALAELLDLSEYVAEGSCLKE